jgi:hypothetical protein
MPDNTKSQPPKRRRTREALAALLGVVALFTWWVWSARDIYRWHETEIAQERAKGWIPLKTFDNWSEIVEPWTIFWPPITRITFVSGESFANPEIPGLKVMIVQFSSMDFERHVERTKCVYVFDCSAKKCARVAVEDMRGPHTPPLDWKPVPKELEYLMANACN